MEIKEFIERFAEAVEIEDNSTCTAETEFRDLDEWNSLAILSIIAMADEEYGVAIKGDEIRNANTIADLYEIVKSKAE